MAGFCVGCGMCCDGTLHNRVVLEDTDDVRPLVEAGASLVDVAERRALRQPCAAYGDGCCTIYEDRPTACRAYQCALLQRYDRGEVTYLEAEEVIRATIAVRDRLLAAAERLAGASAPEPLAATVSRAFDVVKGSADREAALVEHAEMIQDAATFMGLTSRHFKTKRRRVRHGLRTFLGTFEQSESGVLRRRAGRTSTRRPLPPTR